MPDSRGRNVLGSAIVYAVYEYVLIVLPVALYVLLESLHSQTPQYTFTYTPEWNIATIFLVAQGQSLYRFETETLGQRSAKSTVGLLALAAIVVVVLAAANIQFSLAHKSQITAVAMWLLFALASATFLVMIASARFVAAGVKEAAR